MLIRRVLSRLKRMVVGTKTAPNQPPTIVDAVPAPSASQAVVESPGNLSVGEYWTRHNVTLHHAFASREESLDYFWWRCDQYFSYIDLMPVSGCDGQVVLDFGCGPGHDLVGFGTYSKPARLYGYELSSSSLREARARLALHGIDAELIQGDADRPTLPLATGSVDFIHSSGVLHHVPDIDACLQELRRILKQDGRMQVMVYNQDSIWYHLYVAYQWRLVWGKDAALPLKDAFARSTDGEDCPIANVYAPAEFIQICARNGFEATYRGAAVSMHEAGLAPLRFPAIQDRRMPVESRKFLLGLEFDSRGLPLHNGKYAGIDACFELRKK
ncbi:MULTISPECIES: class I SAM-dependent methyltransferase [Bordetella]|uniref:Methyltransferase type 11 domain-containing protein n=2 Tax=Bordetella parapertussis TaxID=519 RepID=K0M7X0_BORPB|nr:MULTISPECIES: class I SAM-dependent methyltransferase [Bordetella]ABF72478.1 unknown [Bordetella parapertussis]KAB1451555.1 class I SAM-dependent methyltransferase [Bordetella bronchiseptica]KAB1576799.1 class I SAM-dependent methyltransferase [Bordetella bronchiseptica]KDC75068.1 methyltransferase domain protein [Bordetella bronchiseptica MBORD635]KDD04898.1 methyltransferase domain protein [Bordetella bronchiseptica MBORD681]